MPSSIPVRAMGLIVLVENSAQNYRSLTKLNAMVAAAPPDALLTLYRTAQHRFVYGVGSWPPEPGFVFGHGFVAAQPGAGVSTQGPATAKRIRFMATVSGHKKVLAGFAAAVVIGLVAFAFASGASRNVGSVSAAGSAISWPQGNAVGSQQPVHDSNNQGFGKAAQNAASACPQIGAVAAQLANTGTATSKNQATLISNQVIGGYRRLEIAQPCSKTTYEVILVKSGSSWQTKSATPMGSHSSF